MSDSFLSQDEIDRLLNADSDNSEAQHGEAEVPGITPYDPHTQRRVIRERLHSLEIINERFARQFRMGLFNLLRRGPDVTAGNIQIQSYHEFARNLPVPTNLNLIHLHPLRVTSLMAFSPGLVFMAVDNLFGGGSRFLRCGYSDIPPILVKGVGVYVVELCGCTCFLAASIHHAPDNLYMLLGVAGGADRAGG